MKTLNEWRGVEQQFTEQMQLTDKVQEMAKSIEEHLNSFEGERTDEFFTLVGALKNFQRVIVGVQHG